MYVVVVCQFVSFTLMLLLMLMLFFYVVCCLFCLLFIEKQEIIDFNIKIYNGWGIITIILTHTQLYSSRSNVFLFIVFSFLGRISAKTKKKYKIGNKRKRASECVFVCVEMFSR